MAITPALLAMPVVHSHTPHNYFFHNYTPTHTATLSTHHPHHHHLASLFNLAVHTSRQPSPKPYTLFSRPLEPNYSSNDLSMIFFYWRETFLPHTHKHNDYFHYLLLFDTVVVQLFLLFFSFFRCKLNPFLLLPVWSACVAADVPPIDRPPFALVSLNSSTQSHTKAHTYPNDCGSHPGKWPSSPLPPTSTDTSLPSIFFRSQFL